MAHIDIASSTWAAVKKACGEGIETATTRLQSIHCGDDDARIARGEISAFRAIMSLAQPTPAQTSDPNRPRIKDRAGI